MTNYANIRYQPAAASTTTVADMAALIALTGMSNGDQALVQATNKLYMYSGTGWYLIATIQNDAPSAITGVSGTYELAVDGTATTITAASTDPEGFPLTWSYSTSGLGSIATVSNTDNVFTITPSTTEADAGTFTLTINATDGINGAVSASTNLTLEFIVIVTNSRYTTALVTATGTSDNNDITDASTNNHTITVSGGDAHAGTFSPYRSGGYSTYFDGAGDYLQLSSVLPSGAFTVSCWAYFNTSNPAAVWSQGTSGNAGRVSIQMLGSSLFFGIGSTNVQSSSGSIVPKTWYHIEAQYSGSQIELFINGSSVGTASNTTNPLSTNFHVGTLGSSWDSSYELDGYVSDLKVVSGTPSGSSTVPTEPLSSSGSALHICHLPYIADGSTNNYSITVNGNVSIKPFSPYDYVKYSATDHGGSVYFDGTTDYIEHQGTFTLPAGTNANWTIECWVNLDQVNLNQGILRVSSTPANGNNDDIYFSEQTGYINVACKAGGIAATTSNYKMTANTWHHIAMVKNSGTIYLYNNGAYCGSLSDSNDYSGSYYVYGGLYYSSSYCFAGHLSDFRISNSAIYTSGTSNFTPPTAPLSSSGTLLHIKGTDASIIDKSQSRNIKITSNITSTTQTKFANTRSIYFGGSTSVNLKETLIFPTTNTPFTGELWFYPTNVAGGGQIIGQADGSNPGRIGLLLGTDGRIRLYWQGANDLYSTNSISDNQWHHIAFVRKNNGYLAVYVNGTETELAQDNNNRSIDSSLTRIGSNGPSYFPSYIQGYIQDVRFTNGLARYTANFTPPTAPLEG